MASFVLLVLNDPERTFDILDAWEAAGASGVTMLASTGSGRIHDNTVLRDDLPLIPSLKDLLEDPSEETTNRTLFTIIEDEAVVRRVIQATEQVLGDLNKPRTGILAVFPVIQVIGLREHHPRQQEDE